jgi:hypothetical protein
MGIAPARIARILRRPVAAVTAALAAIGRD